MAVEITEIKTFLKLTFLYKKIKANIFKHMFVCLLLISLFTSKKDLKLTVKDNYESEALNIKKQEH